MDIELPEPDVIVEDRLEQAGITRFKQAFYDAADTICEVAQGNPRINRLRFDAAKYVVERVIGPIKGPASDWVDDFLKDIRNVPIVSPEVEA